jgi:hypothetical protein
MRYLFLCFLVFLSLVVYAQAPNKANQPKPNWKAVKVLMFDSTAYPVTLNSIAEDLVVLKNKPTTINEIDPSQLKKLKQRGAYWNATVVYVDLKYFWKNGQEAKNEYFILFLNEKKK